MRLATFIETHLEEILLEWDTFAKTLFGGVDKSHLSLFRDHAQEILIELVSDMEQKESPQQQKAKSMGQSRLFILTRALPTFTACCAMTMDLVLPR